jgi:hypothetical protein
LLEDDELLDGAGLLVDGELERFELSLPPGAQSGELPLPLEELDCELCMSRHLSRLPELFELELEEFVLDDDEGEGLCVDCDADGVVAGLFGAVPGGDCALASVQPLAAMMAKMEDAERLIAYP